MTNKQLKAHCEDVIANPQDHLDWVVDMARVALASLTAKRHGMIVGDQRVWWERPSYPDRVDFYLVPPAPELKPIELKKGALMISAYTTDPMNADPVLCLSKEGVIEAIRAAGYEVKS